MLDFKKCVLESERSKGDHVSGHTVPIDTAAHRLEVVTAMVTEGCPLNLLSNPEGQMRRLLEFWKGTLPHRACSDLLPDILENEVANIREELKKAKTCSFVYDGTPKVAEVLAVTITFVSSERRVEQRAVSLSFLNGSLSGDYLAGQLINVLQHDMGLDRKSCR